MQERSSSLLMERIYPALQCRLRRWSRPRAPIESAGELVDPLQLPIDSAGDLKGIGCLNRVLQHEGEGRF